ncbi:hypothetical protein KM427_01910 [Nocardioides sp. LMS-CY]|uniref:hypothetical protein n=1 Tax=Nocardioides sp. (strain LMS-CY) TaxID=2840457 RepID=UPI001C000C8D|nr:hypothetical protein [Nocardioides sp. LMS-CY]QWF22525.1 hypothetical protein KM427_01910 [Nocardioides sp. LMS-CY]
MDFVESWGPNRSGSAKKSQVATHACWNSEPCPEVPTAIDWSFRTDNYFPAGYKPWQTWHEYVVEFTVATTYSVLFYARDAAGTIIYRTTLPNGKVSRVGADRPYSLAVSNKYTPVGGTRSQMTVDWIRVEILS